MTYAQESSKRINMDEKQIKLSLKILTLVMAAYLTSGIIVHFVSGSIPLERPIPSFEEGPLVSGERISALDNYAPVWEKNIFNPAGE